MEITTTGTVKDEEGNVIEKRAITIEKDLGSSLEEAVEMFKEEPVFNSYLADARVSFQSFVRGRLTATKDGEYVYSDEQIVEDAKNWVLANNPRSGGGSGGLVKKLKALSPEKRAEILALLGEV